MSTNTITIGLDLGNTFNKAVGLDAEGKVLFRENLANKPDVMEEFFHKHAGVRVGMETGTHCRWISHLAVTCGCDTFVGDARRLRLVFESSRKNDWNDALKIAEICRTSIALFHPVHLRDQEHHALFQMLKARNLLVAQRTQTVNELRGFCKSNACMLPKCDAKTLLSHLDGMPKDMRAQFRPLFVVLETLGRQIDAYDAKIEEYVRHHFAEEDRLLQTIPGIGPIASAAFIAHVPDPHAFRSARDAGPYFGLVPKQDQSGDKDAPCRITREGSSFMRMLLVNSANYILRNGSAATPLQDFGRRIIGPGNGKVAKRKAKVAVARKLAVTMLAMLRNRTEYRMSEHTESV